MSIFIFTINKQGVFANMTQNLKSNYLRKCHHFFFSFFFENAYFTPLSSSSSSIHNIVIYINTPTTMNNQFEALNAPKNRFTLFHSQFL